MTWVESPPHVDDQRIRHIAPDALLRSLQRDAVPLLASDSATDPIRGRLRAWRRLRADAISLGSARDHRRHSLRSASADVQAALLTEGETLLARPQPDWLDRSRGRSAFYGFHYLGWTRSLLDCYALTGDARFALGWWELFRGWDAARDEVVGDWPGLDVIWYTLGVWSRTGVFVDALNEFAGEPRIPDADWQRLASLILAGGRWLDEEHQEFRPGNWQLAGVCRLAELGAMFPELEEADAWLTTGGRRLEEHLELDFYSDGGHLERSPGYHEMCVRNLEEVALGPQSRVRSWLTRQPKFHDMYAWLATMAHKDGWIPPLQDSPIVRPGAQCLRGAVLLADVAPVIASRLRYAAAEWLATPAVNDELARMPDVAGRSPAYVWAAIPEPDAGDGSSRAQESEFLAGSGYVVLRSCDGDLTTTINAGPYIGHELEPHSHVATLDWVASSSRGPLVWEAGTPQTYDDPDYHRWFQGAVSHSAIVPAGDADPFARHAMVDAVHSFPSIDVVIATEEQWRVPHRRTFVFVKAAPSYWLVTDTLSETDGFVWRLQGVKPWTVAPHGDGASVTAFNDDEVVYVRGSALTVEQIHGPCILPREPARDDEFWRRHWAGDEDEGSYATLSGIEVRGRGTGLDCLIVPGDRGAVGPEAAVAASPEAWILRHQGGRAVDRVSAHEWSRRFADGSSESVVWAVPTGSGLAALLPSRRCKSQDVTPGVVISDDGGCRWRVVTTSSSNGNSAIATVETIRQTRFTVQGVNESFRLAVDDIPVHPKRSGNAAEWSVPEAGKWRFELAWD